MKTKVSRYDGPTARILRMANKAPGGVIRWSEACAEYIEGSPAARKDERRKERRYHISLGHVLKRHFLQVEGTRGFYVLRNSTVPDMVDGP